MDVGVEAKCSVACRMASCCVCCQHHDGDVWGCVMTACMCGRLWTRWHACAAVVAWVRGCAVLGARCASTVLAWGCLCRSWGASGRFSRMMCPIVVRPLAGFLFECSSPMWSCSAMQGVHTGLFIEEVPGYQCNAGSFCKPVHLRSVCGYCVNYRGVAHGENDGGMHVASPRKACAQTGGAPKNNNKSTRHPR